ncbi:MAG TPA: hypothetical protein VIU38_12385 [Anaerolineales bacterium]|jgi:hypothetical protein
MRILWLQRALLGLIAVASLYASIHNLVSTYALGSIADDPVADWEQRFVPLKERLPFVRGVIGYISDSDVPGVIFNAPNDEGEYILSQYALAPIIIVKGTDQEWNVANLSPEGFKLWSAANAGSYDVQPLGRGLYLLHRLRN